METDKAKSKTIVVVICEEPYVVCHVMAASSASHRHSRQPLNLFGNRDTAVPAERNGNLQTLICVLVVRPRHC